MPGSNPTARRTCWAGAPGLACARAFVAPPAADAVSSAGDPRGVEVDRVLPVAVPEVRQAGVVEGEPAAGEHVLRRGARDERAVQVDLGEGLSAGPREAQVDIDREP